MFSQLLRLEHKILMPQALHEADKGWIVDFCGNYKMFLDDSLAMPQSTRFTDEAHFHFNGYMSKQNVCAVPRNTHDELCQWVTLWGDISKKNFPSFSTELVLIQRNISLKEHGSTTHHARDARCAQWAIWIESYLCLFSWRVSETITASRNNLRMIKETEQEFQQQQQRSASVQKP
jgi:hypothetical protein